MKSTPLIKPKIVCLCGSTKHMDLFNDVNSEESLKGNIVLSVGVGSHSMGIDMAGPQKRALDQLHFRKIDLADEVIIIRKNGYIGLSTCDEYWYAVASEKLVTFRDFQSSSNP